MDKLTLNILGCVVAGLILAISQNVALGDGNVARIVLNPHVTVKSDTFTLGHIGQIATNDEALLQRLQHAVLGPSPRPGQSLYMHQTMVAQKLKQAGFDLDSLQISAHGPVKVLRGFHTAGSDEIIQTVRRFIEDNAPWDSSQMQIRPITCQQELQLTSENVTYQVSAPKHTDWLGAETFLVSVLIDGEVQRKINVPAFIEVWSDVVLSARPLGRGQPITAKDIRTERMNLARVPANAVVRPDDVIGKRPNRSIAINTVFRSNLIEQPPLIRKGDIVEVVAENQTLKIGTQAMAREDGGKGMRIALTNLTSKKIIYALVVDSRTVHVQF